MVELKITESEGMPISDFALDKFVEPHFSKFRSASIPVSADESTRWLQAFVLNCMFRGNFVNPTRQFVFNYLRRVEAAQSTYQLARTETLNFLDEANRSVSSYMNALLHWESFLSQCGIAADLLIKLGGLTHEPPAKDNSLLEERMAALYIRSRHVAGMIASTSAKKMPPEGTLAIWMENDGLHACELSVAWAEAVEVLDEFSKIATALMDPYTAREKLKSLLESP